MTSCLAVVTCTPDMGSKLNVAGNESSVQGQQMDGDAIFEILLLMSLCPSKVN